MDARAPDLRVRLAASAEDRRAAERLRYEVFVAELGGDGPLVDHDARLERDRFDAHADHLLLIDAARDPDDQVVGVYRLMDEEQARAAGDFYCAGEYDLSPLKDSGRRLLELGRSCLHRDYRGGTGVYLMWQALADFVERRGAELLFGVASFHGTDPEALAQPLSLLHHRHLAPPELRARALEAHFQRMDLVAPDALDRRAAMLAIPALIKGYLRLGGMVGEGAFVDHDFNTTDVLLILDTKRLSPRQRQIYSGGQDG